MQRDELRYVAQLLVQLGDGGAGSAVHRVFAEGGWLPLPFERDELDRLPESSAVVTADTVIEYARTALRRFT